MTLTQPMSISNEEVEVGQQLPLENHGTGHGAIAPMGLSLSVELEEWEGGAFDLGFRD